MSYGSYLPTINHRSFLFCSKVTLQFTTRNSAITDKPVQCIYSSVKVTKHSTIPYARYSFLLCNSNFVFKTCSFYNIQLQKCRDLQNRVRGPSRSLEMSPCDRAHTTSYWRSIVIMALSRVVSEIFNVEKMSEPWNWDQEVTQGHWKWYHSVDRVWFSISVL